MRLNIFEVLRRAPCHRPLVVLHSARLHPRWSRWSVVAQPLGVLRHQGGRTCWESLGGACEAAPRFTHDPMTDLHWLDDRLEQVAGPGRPAGGLGSAPWRGGWIGYLSYELGRSIEPRAVFGSSKRQSHWPLYEWMWCPQVFAHDSAMSEWYRADLHSAQAISDRELIDALGLVNPLPAVETNGPCLETWSMQQSRGEVEEAVRRTIEYIRAGDIFQANIALQLASRLKVSPRQLAIAAWERMPNWYAAYIELAADRQILSLSPELFLEVDRPQRAIITRPLKGTVASSQQRSTLASSDKDQAELNMIVDLMRNDLGRVCEFGSVQVTQARAIESHPTVHHGVATIEGRLRQRCGFADIVAATFPPGSITGAPKVRAMQIIDELEPFERGPYCGSIGYVGASRVALNVAIRTMVIQGDVVTYGAGAGIVADSRPSLECDEMIAKSAVVCGLAQPAHAGANGADESAGGLSGG